LRDMLSKDLLLRDKKYNIPYPI